MRPLTPMLLFAALVFPLTVQAVEPDVIKEVFDNGLTVLLVERHQAPVVSAVVVFRVGAANEPSGATGIAHLYEHMAFKGTRNIGTRDPEREARLIADIDTLRAERERRAAANGATVETDLAALDGTIQRLEEEARDLVIPNEYAELYQRQGGVGINATTSPDVTSYYVSLPANRLPFWAHLETERMSDPVLREFYAERDVVLEERRMRVDTSPQGQMYEALIATAFMAQPYGNPTIGWPSDLERLTRPQTREFFKSHYTPENTVITLVGDLDPDATLALMAETFGRLPRAQTAPPPHTREPHINGSRRVEVMVDAEPSLVIGFLKPGIHHPDDVVLDLLQQVLTGGTPSRLYRRLVLEDGIATGVYANNGTPGVRMDNLFTIAASPRHPHTTDQVEAAILEELNRLVTEPVTPRELERAANQVEAANLRAMTSNMGLARTLTYFEAVADDWRYPFRLAEQIRELTPERVTEVAKRYFGPDHRTTSVLVPATPEVAP